MKYQAIQDAVFQVFASPAWQSENILTIPVNYTTPSGVDYFLKVSIIPSGRGVNRISASGVVIITIYVREGSGPSKATEIADILDTYLTNKTFGVGANSTQFLASSFAVRGFTTVVPGFTAFEYTVPFNFFGVL